MYAEGRGKGGLSPGDEEPHRLHSMYGSLQTAGCLHQGQESYQPIIQVQKAICPLGYQLQGVCLRKLQKTLKAMEGPKESLMNCQVFNPT